MGQEVLWIGSKSAHKIDKLYIFCYYIIMELDPNTNITSESGRDEPSSPPIPSAVAEAIVPDPEATPVTKAQWEDARKWVIGDPETGKSGVPHTGPLGLERKFGIDIRTATAIFEEMQNLGWITKLNIPQPGKGAMRGGGYDQTRFGGFMVIVNPDGSPKVQYAVHQKGEGPTYNSSPNLAAKSGFLGRSLLGRGAVKTTQAVVNKINLETYHARDSVDFLSGRRTARERDEAENKSDRQYTEIFNPNLGLPNEETPGQTVVTSWMDPSRTKPWARTVPPVELVEELRAQNPSTATPEAAQQYSEQVQLTRDDLQYLAEIVPEQVASARESAEGRLGRRLNREELAATTAEARSLAIKIYMGEDTTDEDVLQISEMLSQIRPPRNQRNLPSSRQSRPDRGEPKQRRTTQEEVDAMSEEDRQSYLAIDREVKANIKSRQEASGRPTSPKENQTIRNEVYSRYFGELSDSQAAHILDIIKHLNP